MEDANGLRSSTSSRSLTPPQSRIPLSSSVNSLPDIVTTDEIFKKKNPPGLFAHAAISSAMNKDSCFTYVHMHQSQHADLFEDFCKDKLPKDDVFVPPDLQPINPEEEDDVVPDQHAAYGVQKATQKAREPAWKDLGLAELMARGPPLASVPKRRPGGKRRGGGGGSPYQGLPR